MRLKLYSVQDKLLGVFLAPFVARGDVEAFRQIAGVLRDERMASAAMVTNPEDFSLFLIGVFDDETGELQRADESGRMAPFALCALRGLERYGMRPEAAAGEDGTVPS